MACGEGRGVDLQLKGFLINVVIVRFRAKKQIHFRAINNLVMTHLSHSVDPHEPLAMCAQSATTLVYVDCSRLVRDIRWLDCRSSVPKPGPFIHTTCGIHDLIWDMCCLRDRDNKQLIVTARGLEGLSAFSNVRSGRLEWNMKGELPAMKQSMVAEGVTTDGRGHIFVCDVRNKYIHMFTTAGYKKVIWKDTEPDLGRPLRIRWCENTSSLNVVHLVDGEHRISKIRVNTEVTALPPLEGTQIKREAEEEDAAEEPTPPPAKKGRWDDSTTRPRREMESASQFKCKGKMEKTSHCKSKDKSIVKIPPGSRGAKT